MKKMLTLLTGVLLFNTMPAAAQNGGAHIGPFPFPPDFRDLRGPPNAWRFPTYRPWITIVLFPPTGIPQADWDTINFPLPNGREAQFEAIGSSNATFEKGKCPGAFKLEAIGSYFIRTSGVPLGPIRDFAAKEAARLLADETLAKIAEIAELSKDDLAANYNADNLLKTLDEFGLLCDDGCKMKSSDKDNKSGTGNYSPPDTFFSYHYQKIFGTCRVPIERTR